MTTSEAEKYCDWIEQKKITTYIIDNYSLDGIGSTIIKKMTSQLGIKIEGFDAYKKSVEIYDNCIMSDLFNDKNEILEAQLTLFYTKWDSHPSEGNRYQKAKTPIEFQGCLGPDEPYTVVSRAGLRFHQCLVFRCLLRKSFLW